jgi:hypothetical protein
MILTVCMFTGINFVHLVAHSLGTSDQYLLSPVNVYILLLKVSLLRESVHLEVRNVLRERGDKFFVYMIVCQTYLL